MRAFYYFIGKNYQLVLPLIFGFGAALIPISVRYDTLYWDKKYRPYMIWIRIGIGCIAATITYLVVTALDPGPFIMTILYFAVPSIVSVLAYRFLSRKDSSNFHMKVDRPGADDFRAIYYQLIMVDKSRHGYGWVRFTHDQILVQNGDKTETCFRKLKTPYATNEEVIQAARDFYNYVMQRDDLYKWDTDWELKPYFTSTYPGVYVNAWGTKNPESIEKRKELSQYDV